MPNKELTVLRAGRLVDGNGGVIRNASVVIDKQRIRALGTDKEVKKPAGATVIDARDCTVMPGLFDLHVHLAAWNAATFNNYRVAKWEVAPTLQSFYALFHAQMTFEMGFTTLRDMGFLTSRGQFTAETCALRDAIAAGIIAGPRLFACGQSMITGSHHDLLLPRAALRQPGATADGPWELKRLTREHIRMGVDHIKTTVSGGIGSGQGEVAIRDITQEELDAIVDEAHAFQKQCAVHCFTAEGQEMCVKAGVDTIEHMVFTSNEAIAMIKDARTPVVPTLLHRTDYAIETRRQRGAPERLTRKAKEIQPHCFTTFKRMHQAGIKIAMGTDLGHDPFIGDNAKELELYVELGMSPMEAIQTATKNAAEAIGVAADLGTLGAGKLADIIAVKGDPTKDIKCLQKKDNIKLVIKEGRVHINKLSKVEKHVSYAEPGSWKIIDNL